MTAEACLRSRTLRLPVGTSGRDESLTAVLLPSHQILFGHWRSAHRRSTQRDAAVPGLCTGDDDFRRRVRRFCAPSCTRALCLRSVWPCSEGMGGGVPAPSGTRLSGCTPGQGAPAPSVALLAPHPPQNAPPEQHCALHSQPCMLGRVQDPALCRCITAGCPARSAEALQRCSASHS